MVNIHSIYRDQLGHLILVSGGNHKNLTRAIFVCDVTLVINWMIKELSADLSNLKFSVRCCSRHL